MKGVSPLVAAVLLIVIVVAIAALVSGWLTQFFANTRETVNNRTDTQVQCSGATIAIESVYMSANGTTNGKVTTVVKNDGLVNGQSIISAQYYNTTGSNFSTTTSLPITSFNRGDIRTLLFENVSIYNCSAFSQVVVSTQCASATHKTSPLGCV